MFKRLKNIGIIATALFMLSGCGASSNNNTTQGPNETDTTSTEATETIQEAENSSATSETKIITTTTGDVEVPVNPQRVVVQYLTGDVLALGVVPIGTSDVYEGAAFEEEVKANENIEVISEWNEESIMLLEPDLIIIINTKDVDKFSKIAPTILVSYDTMTQDERINFLGDVLNRKEEATQAIEKYDALLAESKTKLTAAGFEQYTISVFEGGADATISVSGDTFGAGGTVYKSLGLKAPEAVQKNILDKGTARESISFEVLSQYAGDFVIRNSYEGMADLTNDPIWKALPAVQNNHVIEIPFGLNYYTDIYSTTTQIQRITDALLNSLEQSPTV